MSLKEFVEESLMSWGPCWDTRLRVLWSTYSFGFGGSLDVTFYMFREYCCVIMLCEFPQRRSPGIQRSSSRLRK